MKLTKAQKKIYDLLKERGALTTREIDAALFMTRSSMRISEMNHAHQQEKGEPLIITVRKKKNGEHVKGIAKPLTKKQQKVEIVDGVARVTYEEVDV